VHHVIHGFFLAAIETPELFKEIGFIKAGNGGCFKIALAVPLAWTLPTISINTIVAAIIGFLVNMCGPPDQFSELKLVALILPEKRIN
jgi:hypothetical protein